VSNEIEIIHRSVDEATPADMPASTRRQFVTRTAAGIGGLGLLAVPGIALATNTKNPAPPAPPPPAGANDPQTILNVAATAEVLATIVNTVGWERKIVGDWVTQRNIQAAAREELIHYDYLVSIGGVPVTKKIWVPDAVFARRSNFLNALEVGDQIFVNAYLIATKVFGDAGNGGVAAVTAETMAVEAVHRALARQSNYKLGNDRAFARFNTSEEARDSPVFGGPGFTDILDAVGQLQAAGFGFGVAGKGKGRFYDFDSVSARTPDTVRVNTREPSAG